MSTDCKQPLKYRVAQLGARRHYAVPRILHGAGSLGEFYTDLWAADNLITKALHTIPQAIRPKALRRFLGRGIDIPHSLVRQFPLFAFDYKFRLYRARSPGTVTKVHLWGGRKFCELINALPFDNIDGVYGFNSASLELFQHAKRQGLRTVLEQTILPRAEANTLLRSEFQRWRGWEPPLDLDEHLREMADREQEEWKNADLIICGSEFVKDGIRAQGGPADRCRVVPYGCEPGSGIPRKKIKGPLKVLTVGAVCIRKGAPYVYEVARRLGRKATFKAVGPIMLSSDAQRLMGSCVDLVGAVPRNEISGLYRWADVLLLPSVVEGSAMATYEALSWGIPVVCTPNTGSVVREGRDGFIVKVADVEGFCEALITIASGSVDYELLSRAALFRAQEYSIHQYSERLLSALKSFPCNTFY